MTGPRHLTCPSCDEPGVLGYYEQPEPSNGYPGGWSLDCDSCEFCGAGIGLVEIRRGMPVLKVLEPSGSDATETGGDDPEYRAAMKDAGRGHLLR